MYRDRIFSEFHKRTLTKFISAPSRCKISSLLVCQCASISKLLFSRESHLNQQKLERPWVDLFGKNYVESLRSINDEQSALEHLRIFVRAQI